MDRTFENPANGYRETINPTASGVGAIIFGPLYFAVKGIWGCALAEFLTSVALIAIHPALVLIAFLIQAIIGSFASDMLAKRYLQRGWKEIKEEIASTSRNRFATPVARACPNASVRWTKTALRATTAPQDATDSTLTIPIKSIA